MSIGAARGSFDTEEIRLKAQITGQKNFRRAWIRPEASVSYIRVDREAYTDSAGTPIPGATLEQGKLNIGPTVGYTILPRHKSIAAIVPSAYVKGTYDFARETRFLVSTGVVIETPEVTGAVGGGLAVNFRGGGSISAGGGYTFSDTDFKAWSINASGSMPLSALGLAGNSQKGALSFNLNTDEDRNIGAQLRVKLRLN